MIIFIAITNIY